MKVSERQRREPASPDFVPVRMDDVEIGAPLPGSRSHGPADRAFLRLLAVRGPPPRQAARPDPGRAAARRGSSADALAARIQAELADEVGPAPLRRRPAPERARCRWNSRPRAPLCAVARDELLREAPSVSVVICTRDRPDSVRTTVRSILACRYPPRAPRGDRGRQCLQDRRRIAPQPGRLRGRRAVPRRAGTRARPLQRPQRGSPRGRRRDRRLLRRRRPGRS